MASSRAGPATPNTGTDEDRRCAFQEPFQLDVSNAEANGSEAAQTANPITISDLPGFDPFGLQKVTSSADTAPAFLAGSPPDVGKTSATRPGSTQATPTTTSSISKDNSSVKRGSRGKRSSESVLGENGDGAREETPQGIGGKKVREEDAVDDVPLP
eukprot:1184548-Prorocentrum_minimum.AAC.9